MNNSKNTSHFYYQKGIKVFNKLNLQTSYDKIGTSDTIIKRTSNICIYCNENFTNNKMNHAHLIPELLGKNKSHNEYECNKCNAISGKWETSLGTFTLPIRLMSMLKNKKGRIPKFKSRKDKYDYPTEISIDNTGKIISKLATKDDFLFDEINNSGKLKFRLGGFNPYHVYKAFLKVALSLMPNEILEKENWMINYLFQEDLDSKIFPIVYLIHLDDKEMLKPYFELYKHNNGNKYRPKYLLTAYFGKAIIHIILPIKKPKKKIYINLPSIHKILTPRNNYNIELLDLSKNINEKWNCTFNVDIKKRKKEAII